MFNKLALVSLFSTCVSAINPFEGGKFYDARELQNSKEAYPDKFPFDWSDGGDLPWFSFDHDFVPNLTLDPATDNGGYRYFGYVMADINDWKPHFEAVGGHCHKCGDGLRSPIRYILLHTHDFANGLLSPQAWNCSLKQVDAFFLGKVNNEVICSPGSCCKNYIDFPRRRDETESIHSQLNTYLDAGLCPSMPESIYCIHASNKFETACLQTYFAPTGRNKPVAPCLDVMFFYYTSCPVYKKTGVEFAEGSEPPSYTSKLTVQDVTLMSQVVYAPDRLCLPQQYYQPDSAGDDDESGVFVASLFLSYIYL